ncbi:hypothetical protein B0O99DRAFT_266416 [Bisporella sp. PMI_857]|nr:hypothetical protein B0O99DRAFT_266416 [Bisporella sp. PMI_857]
MASQEHNSHASSFPPVENPPEGHLLELDVRRTGISQATCQSNDTTNFIDPDLFFLSPKYLSSAPPASVDFLSQKTFTLFSQLPAEVRCHIWKEVSMVSRHVDIYYSYGRIKVFIPQERPRAPRMFDTKTSNPAILSASREARIEGLKFYKAGFENKILLGTVTEGGKQRPIWFTASKKLIYLNVDVDVVDLKFMNSSELQPDRRDAILAELYLLQVQQVRSWGFEKDIWSLPYVTLLEVQLCGASDIWTKMRTGAVVSLASEPTDEDLAAIGCHLGGNDGYQKDTQYHDRGWMLLKKK